MPVESHALMDGKVHVYRRENSRYWQCSTYMDGRNYRKSTKYENLPLAMEFAREWYMAVYVDSRRMQESSHTQLLLKKASPYQTIEESAPQALHSATHGKKRKSSGPTFVDAAEKFISEYGVITQGERNQRWTQDHVRRVRTHLIPYFREMSVKEINAGVVQEYRMHRNTNGYKGRIPSRSTLHHETVTLRLVLKTAHRYGWIDGVPDISPPYKASGKVKHRAWFSPEEYKMLYAATRERAKNPSRERYKTAWEDLHDYVLFMANTGLGRTKPDGLNIGM